MTTFLACLSGIRVESNCNLRPLAIWFSNSTELFKTLAVVQAWVKVTPLFLSAHFASKSPKIFSVLASRVPSTLNVTLLGVLVFTMSLDPFMGLKRKREGKKVYIKVSRARFLALFFQESIQLKTVLTTPWLEDLWQPFQDLSSWEGRVVIRYSYCR